MERYLSQLSYNIKLFIWKSLGKSTAAADELSVLGILQFWYFIKHIIKQKLKKK